VGEEGIDCDWGDWPAEKDRRSWRSLCRDDNLKCDKDNGDVVEGVMSSRISQCSSWVGDVIVIGAVFAGKGGSSAELIELVDSRRPREVKGRSAFTRNWPTRVRGLYESATSSGPGSKWTVDFHNMRSHQLGTRFLLDESYTPLSSSSVSSSPLC